LTIHRQFKTFFYTIIKFDDCVKEDFKLSVYSH